MELLEFWEEISLVPDAVRQIESWRLQKGNMRSCGSCFSEM